MTATSWADGPMLAFDIESTGVDTEEDRIVTASAVLVAPGQKPQVQEWLADPGIDIPEAASAVHGITTEHAREHGEPAFEVVRMLSATLADFVEEGAPLVIYNASYDLTLLDRECRRWDTPTLHERCEDDGLDLYVVDPLVLDRAVDQYRKGSRKLVDVARHYGITLSEEDAHTSSGDCLAAARVAWVIAHRFPEIGCLSLAELQERQATAHRKWATGFGDYLRKQGKPDDVSRDWPIRPWTDGALIPAPEAVPARGGLL